MVNYRRRLRRDLRNLLILLFVDQCFNNEFECTLHLSEIAFPAIQDNLELGAQGNRWGCGSLSLGRWKFS